MTTSSFWTGVGALGGALLLLLSSSGCDLTDFESTESVVVEAFVEAERPLPPVFVRAVQGFGDTTASGIETAQVRLTVDDPSQGEQSVAYAPVPGTPGRYEPVNASDSVGVGTRFRLTVEHTDGTAQGRSRTPASIRLDSIVTSVPDEPVEAVRVDSLRRDSLDIPATTNFIYPIDLEAYWTAPEADTAWVRTALRPENQPFTPRIVDFFIQPEAVFQESTAGDTDVRRWRGVYAIPVEEATDPLPSHRLVVWIARGDAEYASFMAERDDPDRREPSSNVTGGLGIITGVAMDSVEVEVP
ncbi:MAG: hypothetical protein R6U20_06935 [Longimonas sp.]|uniref:hypothetical protein n=1 Tax=Longimonas sp. TaxID=2039626 RepID=UPI003976C74F